MNGKGIPFFSESNILLILVLLVLLVIFVVLGSGSGQDTDDTGKQKALNKLIAKEHDEIVKSDDLTKSESRGILALLIQLDCRSFPNDKLMNPF